MCSIQRPLDTRSQVRIAVESEAILGVLDLCDLRQLELIVSDPLLFEARRNPHPVRQQFAFEVLGKATIVVRSGPRLEARTQELMASGIRALDAMHLASAEEAHADFFCTCDDRLARRAKGIADLATNVVSPLDLIAEVAP